MKCKGCNNESTVIKGMSESLKKGFCSMSCALKFRHKNGTQNSLFVKGHKVRLGMKHPKSFIEGRKKEGNPAWKGDKVGKSSLHDWIRDNYGYTGICEHCGLQKKTDWSNKDHKYSSRERIFWQELCRSCHQKYDFANGLR